MGSHCWSSKELVKRLGSFYDLDTQEIKVTRTSIPNSIIDRIVITYIRYYIYVVIAFINVISPEPENIMGWVML